MQLRVMSDARVRETTEDRWGADLTADDALAEVLRAEVTARGQCRRASAITRVVRAVASAVEVSKERVAEVCDSLERDGDFSVAPGGVLHATPLRLVEVQSELLRVVSSLPARHLRQRLPGSMRSAGVLRHLVVGETDASAVATALEAYGGVRLSAAEWAGLELAPHADDAWLDGLDERLKWLAQAPGSSERAGELDWRSLSVEAGAVRWRRESGGPSKLWRARSTWGYWMWAWSGSDAAPSATESVPLTTDEANRTVFAMARSIRQPVGISVAREDDHVIIGLGPWLPRAEYRYLSTMATPLPREDYMNRWSVPLGRETDVLETLGARLGIKTESP